MAAFNEEELIRDLKAGSIKALGAIYDKYASELYAYCAAISKRREDAEEIVQDIFMQLWIDRDRIRAERTLRNLLFVMAKHRLINAFRSTVNAPVFEDYTIYTNEFITNDSHSLEYEDFIKHFVAALNQLTATQRKVVELSRIGNLTNKEIAAKLSLSEQTVKNQLSIGLKQLRRLLQKFIVPCVLIPHIVSSIIAIHNQI